MMDDERRDDIDVMLWDALDSVFWAYAIQMRGSGSVTDKLTQVVKDYLDYLKDQEVCYEEE